MSSFNDINACSVSLTDARIFGSDELAKLNQEFNIRHHMGESLIVPKNGNDARIHVGHDEIHDFVMMENSMTETAARKNWWSFITFQ